MISNIHKKINRDSADTLSLLFTQQHLSRGNVMIDSRITKNRPSSQVRIICKVCGTEFWVKPSQADKRKTCSRKCMGVFQRKTVVLKCGFCGKDVKKRPSQLKQYTKYKSKNVFCDKTCQSKFYAGDGNPNRRKDAEIRLKCKNCGDIFYRPPWLAVNSGTKKPVMFCSRACYNEHVLKKSGVFYNGLVEVVCIWCGKPKQVTNVQYRNGDHFFCDFECQGAWQAIFRTGKDSGGYTHGGSTEDRPSYGTYNDQVNWKMGTRRSPCGVFLEVRCSYCGKWFEPRWGYLTSVLGSSRRVNGDLNLYCSEECKKECPVFWQRRYQKGFKRASSREVSPLLRQMCLERDKWTCLRCGETEAPLHCHHVHGATQNKMISNDIDNVITVCKKCHKEIHRQDGCRYHELKCLEA